MSKEEKDAKEWYPMEDIKLQETLKEAGLYWRKWPEEKPEEGQCLIIITKDSITAANFKVKYGWGSMWYTSATTLQCQEGDLWLPIEALKIIETK